MRGVYDLAAAVRDGRPVTEHLGETVDVAPAGSAWSTSARSASPSTRPQWAAGDDYSHNSKAFADVILPDAPYIDEAALAGRARRVRGVRAARARRGLHRDRDPRLHRVPHLRRASATARGLRGRRHPRRARRGDARGVRADVGVRARPRPEGLLPHRHARAHDAARAVPRRARSAASTPRTPSSGTSTRAGLDELYEAMPYLDGVLIRIGEAGRVYDLPGWDYYSDARRHERRRGARHAHRVHRAGRARRPRGDLPHAGASGVGAVGDMHTNADSYHAVLDGIDSDRAHRLDEVHARRLLQPPAAQRHPRDRRPAPHRRVPEPARVRELRRLPERPRRALPGGAAAIHRREPERRGHLDVDPGRRPVACRPAVARAEGRLLAALRAQHRARRAARARPRRRPRARSPPTGRDAGSPTTRPPCAAIAEAMAAVARRRSPTGCTSARSPIAGSSRSASSRRP